MIPPPRDPIARALFDALDREIEKRPDRNYPGWVEAERVAMQQEASRLAGCEVPMERVEEAEQSACGHFDYMLKFSYRLAEIVRELKG